MNTERAMPVSLGEDIEKTTLEIVTGRKHSGAISNKRIAGYAYLPVGAQIYEMKLMMFPRHTYFVKQNRDSANCYTVYAKRVWENGETKLSSPIGFGSIASDCPNYIELYFPLLGRAVFVNQIPKNF